MPEAAPLTESSWDDLFDFLDPGRALRQGTARDAEAQARYLEITRKLVCFFAGRACRDAEDLAAETVLRVAARCREVDSSGYGDRMGYFFGVARNVHHEWIRHSLRDSALRDRLKVELTRVPPVDLQTWKGREAAHHCLDRCLPRLTLRARRLVVRYYDEERAARIAERRGLAEEFGKSANALRIEVHRIRNVLRECVFGCLRATHAGPAQATARTR
jgi:RNA polymerase sigma factor (sigma-70 family)